MKRLLLLGVLAAALLVPLAAAAPATTETLRGTVVAKDRAHHALVVARPGGAVQMVIARNAFGRTAVGRTVVIRFSSTAGRLPVAVNVSLKGHASKALVRGTIVRLVNQRAIVNAGGSLLRVTLKQAQRTTASATTRPHVGDEVEIEVEFDHHGGLGATVVTAGAGDDDEAAGEMEVRGVVSALTAATAAVPGSITVTVNGLPVSCTIPVGVTLTVKVGDLVELKCDLVGNPAVWTVHIAKNEDDHSGPGHDDASEVEVRGTIAAPFLPTSTTITVAPGSGGAPVTCAIVAGSLIHFAAGDVVKMECVKSGDMLKLKEIEKNDDDSGEDHSGSVHDGGHDDGGGDDNGGGGHDD